MGHSPSPMYMYPFMGILGVCNITCKRHIGDQSEEEQIHRDINLAISKVCLILNHVVILEGNTHVQLYYYCIKIKLCSFMSFNIYVIS